MSIAIFLHVHLRVHMEYALGQILVFVILVTVELPATLSAVMLLRVHMEYALG